MNIRDILKEYRLKVTAPRVALAEILKNSHRPMRAEELKAKKKGSDLVTVYRTLASFEKAGLVRRVDLRMDSIYYEWNGEHHHHIICTNCGDIEDIELCDMESLAHTVVKRSNKFKTLSDHTLEFFGLCNACAY